MNIDLINYIKSRKNTKFMNYFWIPVFFVMILIWVWNANYLPYFIYSKTTLKTIKKT